MSESSQLPSSDLYGHYTHVHTLIYRHALTSTIKNIINLKKTKNKTGVGICVHLQEIRKGRYRMAYFKGPFAFSLSSRILSPIFRPTVGSQSS